MMHSYRRSRQRRDGQILLVAVLMMIVIAVIGSSFAVVLLSGQVHLESFRSTPKTQITA